jgi:hypothetical protein
MNFLKRKEKRQGRDEELDRVTKELRTTQARTMDNVLRVERIRRVVAMRTARMGGG